MTIGSYERDGRYDADPGTNIATVGVYQYKNWNGGDAPVRPKLVYDKQFYYRPVRIFKRDKHGILHDITVEKLRYAKVARPRPRRISLGEHPYTLTARYYLDTAGRYSVWKNPLNQALGRNYYMFSNQSLFGLPNGTSSWTSNDDLALLGKLRTKVAGSDFHLGNFLAEGHEALAMIANSATRIARALWYTRKGNFVQAAKSLVDDRQIKHPTKWIAHSGKNSNGKDYQRVMANNWLELQYGWLPLLSDAEAGAQFLAHMSSAPIRQVVRVTRRKNLSPSISSAAYEWAGFNSSQLKSIKAIIEEKDIVQLSGLLDPLSVAWEVVPYSFVVDWFYPIGSFLQARGLAQALKGTFVTTTVKKTVANNVILKPTYDLGNSGLIFEATAGRFRSTDMTRTVSDTLSVPMPSLKSLGQAASWRHCANAVALLAPVLGRTIPPEPPSLTHLKPFRGYKWSAGFHP